MSGLNQRKLVRVAMVGALVGVLGLAGCGRKGALEPPPGASSATPSGTATERRAAIPLETPVAANQPGQPKRKSGKKKRRGPDQPFFLDWLID